MGIRSPRKRKKLDLPLILFIWLFKYLRRHKGIKNAGKRRVYYILNYFNVYKYINILLHIPLTKYKV